MTNIYQDKTYLKNNSTWHAEDSAWKVGQIMKMINKHKLLSNSVVEVGSGAGEILLGLKKEFASDVKLVGYDISSQVYELAQKKSGAGIEFKLGDFLKTEENGFDLLLAIDVVEHIEDYMEFLLGLRSRAKYKIFHFPLDLSVQNVVRKKPLKKLREEVGHLHFFTKKIILKSLEDVGYQVIDYFYTPTTLDLPAKSLKSWLARWPRKFLFFINKDLAVRLLGGYSLLVLAE